MSQQTTDQPQAKQPLLVETTLMVAELFRSIQGESTHAGRPCTLIRLAGCPLRCRWCDTPFAHEGGRPMTLDQIVEAVEALGDKLVEVTGGEPLAQAATPGFLRALCDAGYEVLLETGGSIDLAPVDPRVVKILDVKCPGSGEHHRNLWHNLDLLGVRDEVKFVLADRADYEWACRQVGQRGLDRAPHTLLFSPVHDRLHPAELARWILDDRLPVRLQVQLHRYLWPDRARGV